MTSVFVGGSRKLGRMNSEVARRLENIIQKQLRVLVGDANGFDRAAQKHLADHGYRSVLVYCTNGRCRNNVGDWPIQTVEFQGRDRGREFYTAKDDAMLRDADYGLFAWDGTSKGTLRNIRRMAEQGKPSVVYVSRSKKSVTVRSADEASALAGAAETVRTSGEDLFCDTRRTTASPVSG
jgi:hypothetical protein